jgi:hypothetical protein
VTEGFYEPAVIRAWRRRGWSIEDAENEARSRPGFGDDIRRVESRLGLWQSFPPHDHAAARISELKTEKRALVVAALEEDAKGESGRPELTITQAVLFGLFERGLERARSTTKKRRHPSYDSIADEYGLKRTWVTPIVKWAEKHQREARKAIRTSKTPPRFSTLVRD